MVSYRCSFRSPIDVVSDLKKKAKAMCINYSFQFKFNDIKEQCLWKRNVFIKTDKMQVYHNF